MIRVLVADDQALVRVGLRKILEIGPDMEVVGEASDGLQAIDLSARLRPDVVLMDIRMPVLDGIEATRRITAANPIARVLVLTTFGLDTYVYEALRAGASGFMLKDAPPEEIEAAVRIVASGAALLAPAVTRSVIQAFVSQPPARQQVPAAVAQLTAREREVLDLLAEGLSNPEISERLHQRGHDQNPRRPDPAEAGAARPGPDRHLRLPARPRPPTHRHMIVLGYWSPVP